MFQHRTGAVPETGSVAAYSKEQNSRACVQIDPCETNSIRVSKAGVPGSSTAQLHKEATDMLRPCHKLNRAVWEVEERQKNLHACNDNI